MRLIDRRSREELSGSSSFTPSLSTIIFLRPNKFHNDGRSCRRVSLVMTLMRREDESVIHGHLTILRVLRVEMGPLQRKSFRTSAGGVGLVLFLVVVPSLESAERRKLHAPFTSSPSSSLSTRKYPLLGASAPLLSFPGLLSGQRPTVI